MSAYEPLQKKPKAPPAPRRATVTSQRPRPTIQPALEVSQPGDALELEADRVADHVMRRGPSGPVGAASGTHLDREVDAEEEEASNDEDGGALEQNSRIVAAMLQRMCAKCETEEEGNDEEEERIHRDAAAPGPTAAASAPAFGAALRSARAGGGEPLPGAVRGFMEPRFGQDFRGVRVHRDATASELTERVQAKAFTVGSDVFFRRGHFEPSSERGKRLIAHELTHVVQQREGLRSVQREILQRDEAPATEAKPAARTAGAEKASSQELLGPNEVELNRDPEGNLAVYVTGAMLRKWENPALEAFVVYYQRRFPKASRGTALEFLGAVSVAGHQLFFESPLEQGQVPEEKALFGIAVHPGLVQSADRWTERFHPELRPVRPALGPQQVKEQEGAGEQSEAGERIERFAPQGRIILPFGHGELPSFVAGTKINAAFEFTGQGAALGYNLISRYADRVTFEWTVWKVTNSGREALPSKGEIDSGANAHDFKLEEPGSYLVSLQLKSGYFDRVEAFKATPIPFQVQSEEERSQFFFKQQLLGPDGEQAFELDESGQLRLRPGASEARSLKDQILEVVAQIAAIEKMQDRLAPGQSERFLEALREQLEHLRELEKDTTGFKPYRIDGVFQSREDSSVTPISAVLHGGEAPLGRGRGFTFVLHDFTFSAAQPEQHRWSESIGPGVTAAQAEEKALEGVKEKWRSNQGYPDGTIRVAVPLAVSGGVRELVFDTATVGKKVRTVAQVVALGAGVASLFLTAGTTASIVVVMVSLTTGAALAVDDIVHAIETKTGSSERMILNMLSLVPFAGTLATVAGTPIKGMQWISLSTGFAEGVLITVDTQKALKSVMFQFDQQLLAVKDPVERLRIERQRDETIARVLGGAAVTGGISLVGAVGSFREARAAARAQAAARGAEPGLPRPDADALPPATKGGEEPSARPAEAEAAPAVAKGSEEPAPAAAKGSEEPAPRAAEAEAAPTGAGTKPAVPRPPGAQAETPEVGPPRAAEPPPTAVVAKPKPDPEAERAQLLKELDALKAENPGFESLTALLNKSQGKLTTAEVYGIGGTPREPASWVAERLALHDRLLAKALADAGAMPKASLTRRVINAMRGNTGAGKTRTIEQGLIPELKTKVPTINPDDLKPDLIKASGGKLTHNQVHNEAVAIAKRFQAKLLEAPVSEFPVIMVDKRFGFAKDVRALAQEAKQSGAEFNLFDVEAPLEQSLIEVLRRERGGKSPIVDFKTVGKYGFEPAREYRQEVVNLFRDDPTLGRYELYDTLPDGQKALVARVSGGDLKKFDEARFKELTALGKGEAEVDRLANTRITQEEISRVTRDLPNGDFKDDVIRTLQAHEGQTWQEAVDTHAKGRTDQ